MTKSLQFVIVSLVMALLVSTSTSADPPVTNRPLVWTWSSVDGTERVVLDENYTAVVNVNVVDQADYPDDAAVDAVTQILSRDLPPERICLLFQNFGRGQSSGPYVDAVPLPYDPGDELSGSGDLTVSCGSCGGDCTAPAHDRRFTPWMGSGVANATDWVEEFIETYNFWTEEQDDPRPPSRLHMDTEVNSFICCVEDRGVVLFENIRTDTTHNTVYTPSGTTSINSLWNAAGITFDKCKLAYHTDNVNWTLWYQRVWREAVQWAMKAALYDPFTSEWPGCLTSDYSYSQRTDGSSSPARDIIPQSDLAADWYRNHWQGAADMQAPVLYPKATPGQCDCDYGSAEHWEFTLAMHGHNLTACANSFGGGHSNEIVAWLPVIGQCFVSYSDCDPSMQACPNPADWDRACCSCYDGNGQHSLNRYSKDELRDLAALAYSKGVMELFLWSDPDPMEFNGDATKEVIDQAYGAEVQSASIVAGSLSDGDDAYLKYDLATSNDSPEDEWYAVQANGSGNLSFTVSFASNFQDQATVSTVLRRTKSMKIVITVYNDGEEELPATTMQVHARDWWADFNSMGPNWDLVSTSWLQHVNRIDVADACGLVDADGNIQLKISLSGLASNAIIAFDMVQVYETDFRCAADIDGDGDVDAADESAVSTLIGMSAESCAADVDFDGDVDSADLGLVDNPYYCNPCSCP